MSSSAAAYQRALARLVVDEAFFDAFSESRESCISSLGLSSDDAQRLIHLDLEQLKVFRDVIDSTREINFASTFSEIKTRLSDENWLGLLRRFRRKVILRDSSDMRDFVAFCDWLEQEWPGSRIAELARYQYTQQLLGDVREMNVVKGQFALAQRVEVYVSLFEIDDLLETSTDGLWYLGDSDARYLYCLKGVAGTLDMTVFQLPVGVPNLLRFLRKPRSFAEVLAVSSSPRHELVETLRQLEKANLITPLPDQFE